MKLNWRRICVFCGSGSGARESYQNAARDMGRALAERGLDLVFGGGSVGLMGVIADEMLRQGRDVIGIIPHGLAAREVAHQDLSDLRVVRSMHERKSLMAELSDAFIAMPGGFGTFEELFEIVTWAQLGIHSKPIGILNVDGYFDPLLALVERGVSEEFIRPHFSKLLTAGTDVEELLVRLEQYEPPGDIVQWVELAES